MAFLDDLIAAQDNLAAELKAETAYRVLHGAKPTYTANGRNVDWSGWLAAMTKAIADINAMILAEQNQNDPYEFQVHNYL